MKNWKSTLVFPQTSILEALKIIDNSSMQIALVVDENHKLLGTITDGDVRRAILRQVSLKEPVKKIMFTSPTVASVYDDKEKIINLMRQKTLKHIPLVDDAGCVAGIKALSDMMMSLNKENLVVLMAGGLGTRLRPMTEDNPKPMLEIGGKPILETILEGFVNHGFQRFYVSVNYKAEMIEEYFGDGSRWGVEINYLREKERMGTAGALSLLPEKPEAACLVMNADLLTKVNFQQLLDFHYERQVVATMAVREYDFQVPYGVVEVEDDHLLNLDEKPVHRFFINAGIYVLEPKVLDFIPQNQLFNMTDLFGQLLEKEFKAATFPLREYWLDIGRLRDFEKANGEYPELFK